MSRIDKKKKTIFNVHRPLQTTHQNISRFNKSKDRFSGVQLFEHKRIIRKKDSRCNLTTQQLHSRINLKKISKQQQKTDEVLENKNESLDFESQEDSSMSSLPYLETIFFGENEPCYLKIFAINGDEALKLNLELGRFFFFSQGPLDFESVSLVVLTVCNYLKCVSVKEIFISYGCIASAEQTQKDEKISQELIKLVEDILERQTPAKSQYFSKQLLAYSYFLVQYVWQICILCMGVGLQEENKQLMIENQEQQDLTESLSKDEQDSDDDDDDDQQECENDSQTEKQLSNESPVSKSSSLTQKGTWRADKRSWEEIPMELLLSEELLALLNLRYQQLYNNDQTTKSSQKNQESDETTIDQDTLIGYVRCILKVRDSTFDYKKIHSLPQSIRNLAKSILKHPNNLINTLIPAKQQLKGFSFEQFSKLLLLITESSIFIGFTIFAKQIEW